VSPLVSQRVPQVVSSLVPPASAGPRRIFAAFAVIAAVVVGPSLVAPAVFDACASAQPSTVAVVVDFGAVGGSPDVVDVRCVAPAGSPRNNGAQALVDAGFRPRYDPGSGLLCAINGVPASGCGERTAEGRYRYWSYWRKSADQATEWRYAAIGPAQARVQGGDVEGWRFVEAAAGPQDPQPRRIPDQAALCGPPPSAVPLPPPPAPTPVTPTDAAPLVPRPGDPAAPEGSTLSSIPPGAPTDPPSGAGEEVQVDDGAEVAGKMTERAGGQLGNSGGVRGPDDTVEALAGDVGGDRDGGEGGSAFPWGVGIVTGLIVGLGVAAAVRFRQAPAGP
jgi:hypothetical protein